jgi:hypothetical protein
MFTKNPKIVPNKNFSCEHVQTVPFCRVYRQTIDQEHFLGLLEILWYKSYTDYS